MKTVAIITAGGTSSRFGNNNKLLEKVYGKEIIRYTVEAFEKSNVDEIVICANKTIISDLQKMFTHKVIEGGSTRQESVYNGLKTVTCDYVLIHDGARPIITPEMINNTISAAQKHSAVTVMTKTIDTIKEVEDGKIIRTIDRSKLYNTQTPQAFEYNLIKKAHEKLKGQSYTDDAGMIEALGYDVYIVEGDYKNIKITTPSDIEMAKIYLK
ncbi:2-C-methyl-D-erythritol 4-phosphate cytidylyltransferase [bacterium]|nr:2-C-methyl-D-erythritol 4-phosphate cytidylyltransferase [bacterium]